MNWNDPNRYGADIALTLATRGGHLSIGRGGFALHYETARLSGYDCETIEAAAIAAGLPVIDSREAPFDAVAQLAVRGPMVAVNQAPSARPLARTRLRAACCRGRRLQTRRRRRPQHPRMPGARRAL